MLKSFGKPTRVIRYLALAALLLLSVFWFACSDTRQNATGPQVGEISSKISPSQLASVMAIQDKYTPELLAMKGVVGTATGLDAKGNPAIKVYTENKMVTGIPKQLDGVAVDVEVKGKAFALALTGRYRPVPIGVSVGNNGECSAGTIGCVVTKGGVSYILSNNHVLARVNQASPVDIVQPGRYDNKPKCANLVSTNKVAELSEFVEILFGGPANRVDAAIARLTTTDFTCATLSRFYGLPNSAVVTEQVGMGIKKVGRTTSLTTGTITAVNATVNVSYGSPGLALFTGQIITSNRFCRGGDSGSLVVTNNDSANPVGLLFAGFSDGTCILNQIDEVKQSFGVSICGK